MSKFYVFACQIPLSKKNKKKRYKEELEERLISLIASLFAGILRGSRRERLLSKFVENECEKIDRIMELYVRYSDRVKAETERLNQLELDDLEIDEEEKYNRKLDSGLYTLQLIAVILGHLWTSEHSRMRARIELLLKQHKLTKKDVKDILQVLASQLNSDKSTVVYSFMITAGCGAFAKADCFELASIAIEIK
ncbi:UNVERIFIED_CONTAM: hypothetical protein Sangu_0193600 [Sesamum angustifolium]|uniref:Beta-catenin-like protein 1 N-terminal domain-containing protein n=1 Tax=Sesamum angustifolium TaxID=2727405 RepID=A0AAW2RN06_9LAMI